MLEIRKIVVGPDFKDGMALAVGQKVVRERDRDNPKYNEFKEKIERIVFHEGRYEIWVITLDGSKEVKLWKYYENMPIAVELYVNY